MKTSVTTQDIRATKADCIAVLVMQDEKSAQIARIDRELDGLLLRVSKAEEFSGKAEQVLIIPIPTKLHAQYVALVGVGKSAQLSTHTLHLAAGKLVSGFKARRIRSVAIGWSEQLARALPVAELVQYTVEGIRLGGYEYTAYKGEESQETARKKALTELWVHVARADQKHAQSGLATGTARADGTLLARDLVNEPSSQMTPARLATVAQSLAHDTQITAEVFDKRQIEKFRMDAYLSVARGSYDPPKLIRLTYKPKKPKQHVVIIGKGVTFDTGGLSIKPSKAMETMKLDMAGAAAILGVFAALSVLKPAVAVTGLIAATDNMPGPTASKPGDVVRARNGKTIEILNTDAEGRLTLADMLSWASEDTFFDKSQGRPFDKSQGRPFDKSQGRPFDKSQGRPDAIVDLATLTGACMVALGQDIAGLFGNDDKLVQDIKHAALASGEKLWELPLEERYKKLLKSTVADVRNIATSPYGGAVTAALFLQEFVAADIPWAHLDIAGPAFAESSSSVAPKGGTGFGVGTILSWLKAIGQS